jgi:hypothetical protein
MIDRTIGAEGRFFFILDPPLDRGRVHPAGLPDAAWFRRS